MRIRDPTRRSLIEFRGPVFPIDVTGQDVGISSLFHLNSAVPFLCLILKILKCGKTSAPGDAQRKMPGHERQTGARSYFHIFLIPFGEKRWVKMQKFNQVHLDF